MSKIYILDTNVLLHDPRSLFAFKDNEIVIPLVVLDELDKKKSGHDEVAKHARMAIRLLDKMRSSGHIHQGVPTNGGGLIRVELNYRDHCPPDLDPTRIDNRLIGVALGLKSANESRSVTLITKDINLRVKCDALGVSVADYVADSVATNPSSIYSGYVSVVVDGGKIDVLHLDGSIDADGLGDFYPNQYVHLQSNINKKHSVLARFLKGRFIKIKEIGEIWGISSRNREQAFALDALFSPEIKLVTLIGSAGSGKAQPLNAKILTPDGWKKIGEMHVGDTVCTPDGGVSNVTGVFPQGKKEIYEVIFTDGSSTRCCKEHLWYTLTSLDRDHNKSGKIKSLSDIMSTMRYGTCNKRNHSIPITKPVYMNNNNDDIKIDPYILGIIIGDGCISGVTPQLSTTDDEIYNEMCVYAEKNNLRLVGKNDSCDYYISKKYVNGKRTGPQVKNTLTEELRKLDLFGIKSYLKFIPNEYKFTGFENRLGILQGLMDTDGTVGKCGHTTFTSTSEQLANDVKFLVQSLGGTAKTTTRITSYTHNGQKLQGRRSFNINIVMPNDIVPFRLSRKIDRVIKRTKYFPRRYIDSVKFIGVEKAQCISIDSKEHLYITDDFIVTHNTLLSAAAGVSQVFDSQYNSYKKLIMTRPIQPLGRDLGYLPGDVQDKLKPWMAPLQDNLDLLFSEKGSNYLDMQRDSGVIQVEALTYIRGRSIPKSYIIVDECLTADHKIIMSDGTTKNVEDISVGDKVLSLDINNNVSSCGEVDGVIKRMSDSTISVRFQSGIVECTPNHPFYTFKDFCYSKVVSNDLQIGDFIPSPIYTPHETKYNVSSDFAYFLGMILSDGHIEKNMKTIKVAVKKDMEHFKNKFVLGLKSIGYDNLHTEFINKRGDYTICFNRKKIISSIVGDFKLPNGNKSKIIKVPDKVFSSSLGSISSFISACFDAEGDVNITNSNSLVINYSTASSEMAKDIQILLKKFGILSSKIKIKKNDLHRIYRVYMTGINAWKFYDKIGFHMSRKQNVLKSHFKNFIPLDKSRIPVANILRKRMKNAGIKSRDKAMESISGSKNIYKYMIFGNYSKYFSEDELSFIKNYNFQEVRSVTRNDIKKEVFDFRVKNYGTFCVDGIITSNCQNLTPHEVKTIITRVGEGSKLVFTGDILQIDNPFIDSMDNGLSGLIEKFKGQNLSAHVTLHKGERSELATIAAEIL